MAEPDATTTPIGLGPAALRVSPWLLVFIPYVGSLLVSLFLIPSLVWVIRDPERRSAYDRLAGTRVVHKRAL